MRTEPRWILVGVLVAFLAGAGHAQEAEPPKPPPEETPKPAQIEDEPKEVPLETLPTSESTSSRKFGRFYVEGGVFMAQPTGLEYTPAIAYQDSIQAVVIDMTFKTETPPRWRFGWEMPNDVGTIIGTYFGYEQQQEMTAASPGNYVYGEVEAFPLFAGAFENGLADAFSSRAQTTFREIRFDFARQAFAGPHANGTWFAGLRRVIQRWNLDTQYYSLVQPPELFPPIIPPLGSRPDLAPLPDVVSNLSDYEGRGIEAGLDLKFPFDHAGKFSVEAGFAVAALRGKLHSDTYAQNHYYQLAFEGVDYILAAPYDIFTGTVQPSDGSTPIAALPFISQQDPAIRLQGSNISRSSFAVDAYLGFRWKVWHELEVFGGYRDQRYDDAGEIVRPQSATVLPNGSINVQSISRTPISTTYEGFYFGVGYLF